MVLRYTCVVCQQDVERERTPGNMPKPPRFCSQRCHGVAMRMAPHKPIDKERARAQRRAWAVAHPEKVREIRAKARRKYRMEHPEEARAYATERNRKWNATNPDKRREHNRRSLLRKYGLTLERYEAMLVAQGHACAICQRHQTGSLHRQLYIDHDHRTGIVRGLLCYRCNTALGQFGDDAAGLWKALNYVMRSASVSEVA